MRTRLLPEDPDGLVAFVEARFGESSEEPKPVLVCLSDVQPETVDWIWRDRIAKGKLSLLIGDPGLGKSTVLIDVACRISVGGQWPDGGYAPMGSVIILSAEDGLADTVRPRIERQGGDSSRIHALTAIRDKDSDRPFNLAADLSHLERAIREVGNVQLIIIDPISAYLGKTDAYKDAEVRTVLGPVATLLERYRVAVCGVAHLTKSDKAKALHRSLNSIAFVAAARTVFGVGVDGDDPERRLLVAVKNKGHRQGQPVVLVGPTEECQCPIDGPWHPSGKLGT